MKAITDDWIALEDEEDEEEGEGEEVMREGEEVMQRRRRMKKLILSQMEKQSGRFMSCFSPIQSEKENSSNSRDKKANTGLGMSK